ncbi:MAG: MFS transporter [Acidimicrobiia bacterium]|jgi:MFS family permease
MPDAARSVQRTYLLITLLSTLSASFIWGINTLFLLDAGLSNAQAFGANAFFTAGMVLFEVPTGVVADTWGRRASYLLGALTLLVSTVLYIFMWETGAPFWAWAAGSAFIGLGFTFFSGAVEAWLVDALNASGFTDDLESVFARGQAVAGAAMLTGSVAGGFIAQHWNLGVPYVLRAIMLGFTFLAALVLMKDIGFEPKHGAGPVKEMRKIVRASIDGGWRNRPVRWLMLAAPFTAGVGIFAFYAMQPYLLELYGDETAFGVAGIAAAIVAGAQIGGGLLVPVIRRFFARRTHALVFFGAMSTLAMVLVGLTDSFYVAIAAIVVWALSFAAAGPMRQAYINAIIPSEQRATVLSFDSLMGSTGGVVIQPALGRAADVWSYSTSYVVGAAIQVVAIPFYFASRAENAESDPINA